MLSEASRLGIEEIMSTLDDASLLSLAATITQGLLKNKLESRQEAVNAIINYSPDAISILKRKIITREILLSYLHSKNVSIALPATKHHLIQRVAESWNIQYKKELDTNNTVDSASITLLAEQFAQWFYSQMNENECLNHEHFYQDSKVQINMMSSGQVLTEVIENNPQDIVKKLFWVKTRYHLYFNPNLSREGVRGWVDPYGLVMVMVCGTLHTNGACVGVFEQMFALVRDPQAENYWKIKNSQLNLKSQSGVVMPPTLDAANVLSLN